MTRKEWLSVVFLFLGIVLAFGSYLLLNAAPPEWRWPAVYAAVPTTHELIEPLTGAAPFQTFVLRSWADSFIPFVPLMAIPYLSYLAIVPVLIPILNLLARSLKTFYTMAWALIGAQVFLDLGFFFFQTWVERSAQQPDGFEGFLVGLVWGNDQPFNGFPSGHCTWTTIGILSLWRLRKRFPKTTWITMIWLLSIFPANVMLQQHYLMDVYAGIAVGIAAYSVAMFAVEKPKITLPARAS